MLSCISGSLEFLHEVTLIIISEGYVWAQPVCLCIFTHKVNNFAPSHPSAPSVSPWRRNSTASRHWMRSQKVAFPGCFILAKKNDWNHCFGLPSSSEYSGGFVATDSANHRRKMFKILSALSRSRLSLFHCLVCNRVWNPFLHDFC